MPKRRKYSAEFKREAVALANQPGVTRAQIGRELDINPNMISACLGGPRYSLKTRRANKTQKYRSILSCSNRAKNLVVAIALGVASPAFGGTAPNCDQPKVEWTVQWENDSFPSASRGGSDRFYTNGIRLSRSRQGNGWSFLDGVLSNFWFASEEERPDTYCGRSGFRIGHQFYTPQTILSPELDVNDRPYAGFLYGAVTLGKASRQTSEHSDIPKVFRTAELQFGIVGPAAGARGLQSEWHRVSFINAETPQGWHNQLPNEFVANLNMTAARRWSIGDFADVVPQLDLAVGTVFTGARLRTTFRLGNNLTRFPYTRIVPIVQVASADNRAQPAVEIPVANRSLAWWFFVGAEGELVAHDIFLDGTLFSDSHSVDSKLVRTILSAGIHAEYRSVGVDLMWVTHSKEFETQAIGLDRHEYLSIGVSWGLGK